MQPIKNKLYTVPIEHKGFISNHICRLLEDCFIFFRIEKEFTKERDLIPKHLVYQNTSYPKHFSNKYQFGLFYEEWIRNKIKSFHYTHHFEKSLEINKKILYNLLISNDTDAEEAKSFVKYFESEARKHHIEPCNDLPF